MSSGTMRLSGFFSFLILLFSVSEWALAGPTVTSVAGASNANLTGTVTIFGGLSGDLSGCAAGDTYSTCNSCTTAGIATCTKTPLCPCNQARIYDNLILTIYFSNTTKDANGNATTTNGNILVTQQNSTTVLSTVNPNNGGTSVQMTWASICAQVTNGGGGSCETLATTIPNASVSLNFYTDANNDGQVSSGETATAINFRILGPDKDTYSTFNATGTSDGIGAFEPYPGDGKVYIKDPQTSTSFPQLGYGGSVKNVRVFYSKTNLTDATPLSESKDLAVTDDGESLSKNIVSGLSNGMLYFFRLGMLDEAGNVVQLSPDPTDQDAADPSCTSSASSACKYSATPDEVLGLLTNDFNCFVATAAYGSMLEPKLAVFREFRARFLLRNRAGRAFTNWYYAYGPYAARFIGDKPWARAITRGMLWPAWGFGWLAVHYGLRWALTMAAAILAILGWAAHVTWPRGTGARD